MRQEEIDRCRPRYAIHRQDHLAVAIARACIREGARGRFYNVVDLGNHLEARLGMSARA